jgi:hypothetical protein
MVDYVRESRKKDIAFCLFPILTYALLPKTVVNLRLGNLIQRQPYNVSSIRSRKLAIVFPLWFLWSKYNPWKKSYHREKGRLLAFYYMLYGDRINFENTLLPRWWTESYVNYKIRSRYRRKLKGKEYDFDVNLVDFEVGTNFIEKPVEDNDDDDDDDDDEDDD